MQEDDFTLYPRLVSSHTRGWEALAKLGETIELNAYEMVINPSNYNMMCCYVVVKGSLAAKKMRQGRGAVTYGIRRQGSLLFEWHPLYETPQREVYFETLTPVTLKRITKQQLDKAFANNSEVSHAIVGSLFEKLASCVNQIEDSHTRTATERLLSLLQELAVTSTCQQPDPKWLFSDLRLSQQTMADMLCVNRVTVAKSLNALKERGDISMKGRRILVSRASLRKVQTTVLKNAKCAEALAVE